jgi:hypothetical protein
MNSIVKLTEISEDVEGLVVLSVDGFEFVAFSPMSEIEIKSGGQYYVTLTAQVWGDECPELLEDEEIFAMEKVDDAFGYMLKGKLVGDCLRVGGAAICEESFGRSYGYMDGKMVVMVVDRIDVQFLSVVD